MPSVKFSRFAAEVEEIYELKAPATLCKMRQVLREFGELASTTADLKPVTIARWIKAHPERHPTTADSLLRSFRSAVGLGMASGYIARSPFAARLEIPDLRRHPAGEKCRHCGQEEIRRVLETARREADSGDWKSERLEALVNVYAYAALRKNEALYLRREDFDPIRHVVRIEARRRLKTRDSAAPVPLVPELEQLLRRWQFRAGSPWLFPGVTKRGPWTGGPPGHKPLDQVKALGERAGVSGLTILSFRHSFATHARTWGLSELMLKAILRHTTVRTQRAYLHDDLPDLVDAAKSISYRVPEHRAARA